MSLLICRCVAQDGAEPNQNKDQNQNPAPSQPPPPELQTNQPTTSIAKVENDLHLGVNKAMDLPAHWFLGAYVPSSRNLQPLTNQERGDVYIRQTYLTGASYLKRLFAAGIDQARDTPNQWGGGFGGYGKRFGSRYGQFIIQNSLTSIGDAGLHYEPRYDLCRCSGFWPRTRHALARNFITYDRTEVKTHFQFPLYVGAFGAGTLAGAWKPGDQSAWHNGVYATLSQAGYGAISTWLQEFALDIGRKLSRRKP